MFNYFLPMLTLREWKSFFLEKEGSVRWHLLYTGYFFIDIQKILNNVTDL